MNVGLIGCGQVGQKRVRSLGIEHTVVAVADLNSDRAACFAKQLPSKASVLDWRAVAEKPGIEVVIVATTHNALAEVTLACVSAGKHVLVEKPAACRPQELDPVIEEADRNGCCVEVGFNHRFHPALQKARQIVDSGVLGTLTTIRGRYGHGGHIGYEREWRSDPSVAGGGELIDQGMHLIDLSRWFLGDFEHVSGLTATYFWQRPVEDNAFLLLRTRSDHVAWLHVNCAEWKNLFSFEIFGRDGKLQVDGLGGSYGVERLTFYKMLPEMGPPETYMWEYPFPDRSWGVEFEAFARAVENGTRPPASLHDAKAALTIVEKVYTLNRNHFAVAGA